MTLHHVPVAVGKGATEVSELLRGLARRKQATRRLRQQEDPWLRPRLVDAIRSWTPDERLASAQAARAHLQVCDLWGELSDAALRATL